MSNDMKMVAQRLKGLREVMDISIEEAAETCSIKAEEYTVYEKGEIDIPVSILHSISQKYGVELTLLLTGEEPHMKNYSLTRKGRGIEVERRKDYKYQSLAYSFKDRKAEPFVVTVGPEPADKEIHFNSHSGHEFNYILDGRLQIVLDGKELILEEGDSLYFDSTLSHGMKALDNKSAKFLALIF